MSQPKIEIFADGGAVARAALQFWIERHSRGGPFWVSLAGGTTPKELYRMLAEQPLSRGCASVIDSFGHEVPVQVRVPRRETLEPRDETRGFLVAF